MPTDYRRLKLTVTLDVDVLNLPDGVTLDAVEAALARSRWDEGRYPFHEEMAQEGLRNMLTYAIGKALGEVMREQYGDEQVPTTNGYFNRAYHEAGKTMKTVYVGTFDGIKDAHLTNG